MRLRRRRLLETMSLAALAGLSRGPGGALAADSLSELPEARRVRRVEDGDGLATALAEAAPGDHIVLADGSYDGSFELGADGEAGRPIVVRPERFMGATLRADLHMVGDHGFVAGLDLNGAAIVAGGDGTRVTRCRVATQGKGYAVQIVSGRGVRIDHCEIVSAGQGIGLRLRPRQARNPQAPLIDHNWLHDFPGRQGENVHEGIQIGQTWNHSDIPVRAVVEHNLLERVSIDDEAISIKSSENIIRFNTLLECRGDLSNRHGERNQYVANWLERSLGLIVFDRDNLLLGNLLSDCKQGIRIMAGDVEDDSPEPGMPYAMNTRLVGNRAGRTVLGAVYTKHYLPLPARDTAVGQHEGDIETDNAVETKDLRTKMAVPAAARLGREACGVEGA